tara:strand:+ start:134 stop:328 length:195 start_codon:yes stop_codon:yes gene_type:complete
MTSILGLSAFYHDSAAALIKDGKIIAAGQEERMNLIKDMCRSLYLMKLVLLSSYEENKFIYKKA